ncbi:MAG: hypothetical protein MUE94_04455 [Verrucomicrobia bacterium]|jgi:hypothetical protein|nr:hypothetical protein [Verrucomicrobiota bacterium]
MDIPCRITSSEWTNHNSITGGFYAGVTNQPAAVFHVNGLDLEIGGHPVYALVRTTDGLRYRTAPLTVTLAP